VPLTVRRAVGGEWLGMLSAAAIAWPGAWWFLERYTDPAHPAWDSLTLTLSLVATWAQARKLLESWLIYIVVDVVSVPLFFSQQLRLTAMLYAGFGVLCVIGLRDWRRSMATTIDVPVPA
jgi:nicotinamide mononucleotide transporter